MINYNRGGKRDKKLKAQASSTIVRGVEGVIKQGVHPIKKTPFVLNMVNYPQEQGTHYKYLTWEEGINNFGQVWKPQEDWKLKKKLTKFGSLRQDQRYKILSKSRKLKQDQSRKFLTKSGSLRQDQSSKFLTKSGKLKQVQSYKILTKSRSYKHDEIHKILT